MMTKVGPKAVFANNDTKFAPPVIRRLNKVIGMSGDLTLPLNPDE